MPVHPGTLWRTAICQNYSACKIESSAPMATYQGCTLTCALHLAFQIPYVNDYETKIRMQETSRSHTKLW